MVRHILVSQCPEGIERADRMVRFLREIAWSLHLPQEGRDDERVHNELMALVQRWVFGEVFRMVTPLTPLVFHLQEGGTFDPLGLEPMLDCQSLLTQHRTPVWVPLYLHSLTGSPKVDE